MSIYSAVCKFTYHHIRTFAFGYFDPIFSRGHPVAVLTLQVRYGRAVGKHEAFQARNGTRPISIK